MKCTVCHYEWCWTCGLSKNSWFHKLQILKEDEATGIVCTLFNDFSINYLGKFKWCIFPVRALVTFTLAILGPLAFLVCFTFLIPFYLLDGIFGGGSCGLCKCLCSLILYAICLPFTAIAAVLIYVLFYIIAVLLLPLWIF